MRKNKIRILHVAQAAGGVDRYIRMLLKYLDKEKFENILICSQDFHEEDFNTARVAAITLPSDDRSFVDTQTLCQFVLC